MPRTLKHELNPVRVGVRASVMDVCVTCETVRLGVSDK